ncbi:MAG: TIGR01244 family sulfur transferase [Pseudomonadota bacterium]
MSYLYAMDIRKITAKFFAAPQISPADLPQIAEAGIKRVLCNRPDEEIPQSHHASVMADAARTAGLEFVILPLTHQNMTLDVIAENKSLMAACEGPVLAYCASGTRSTIAWAIGMASEMNVDDIIEAARQGGYDLRNLRPTLEAAARL